VWHEVNGLKIHTYAESVAWGIGTMLADPDKARWMGHNGRLSAETSFSWDHIAEDVLATYNS
jgi:glycosyltransferase involved in cell wall biosynthesis